MPLADKHNPNALHHVGSYESHVFPFSKFVFALSLAATSGLASAAGFQLLEQNLSGLGNSYAGSAAIAENASTIFTNPAGMTQLMDREFSGGLAVIAPSFKFTDKGSVVGSVFKGNGGDAGQTGYVPNAYMSWALNKDLYVGVGFSAPFGLKTEYSSPWVGSAQANSFAIETYNMNPSIAFRVNDALSVGGGVSWQHIDATYKRLAATGAVPGVPAPVTTASTVTAKLSADGLGWNVGALFNVSPETKVGVSYRSTVTQNTKGDIAVTGPSAAFNSSQSSGAKADLNLPDTFILSGSHQLSSTWELLGDVSWTGWSSIPKLDLVRTSGASNGATAQTLDTDFRDTFRVAVGANYRYSEDLTLKFGLATDQSPVKNETTRLVSLPDADRTQVSTGAQWKLSNGAKLDIGVAYLTIADTSINNNQLAKARGLVTGTYSGSAWILGAQYSMPF
jgi:long-chain fatty acid transport protein